MFHLDNNRHHHHHHHHHHHIALAVQHFASIHLSVSFLSTFVCPVGHSNQTAKIHYSTVSQYSFAVASR